MALFEYLTEGRLASNAMPDVYDRVNIDGLRFDYVSGRDHLRDALVRTFPREQDAIDRCFKAIHQCARRLPLYFAEKTLPRFFRSVLGMGLRAPFLRFARHTTGHVLDDLGASRELKAVLTVQWGDYGLPPGQSSFGVHAVMAEHYVDGAAYPIGGQPDRRKRAARHRTSGRGRGGRRRRRPDPPRGRPRRWRSHDRWP